MVRPSTHAKCIYPNLYMLGKCFITELYDCPDRNNLAENSFILTYGFRGLGRGHLAYFFSSSRYSILVEGRELELWERGIAFQGVSSVPYFLH